MTTYRKVLEHWTETKRVVLRDGVPEVKQVTCCCTLPAGPSDFCAASRGCTGRCRCFCHSKKPQRGIGGRA